MAAMAGRWGDRSQQDAHELLVALLDRLQCEVLAVQVGRSNVCKHRPTKVSGNAGEQESYIPFEDAKSIGA